VKSKTILLVTPFCNEEQSIAQYINSFSNLDYPKCLIDVLWIENNSSDRTWELLQGYTEEFKSKYRSFRLIQMSAGIKVPKESYGEYEKNWGGAKVGREITKETKKVRADLLIAILNFTLSLGDKTDYTFFLFADCVVQPDIINVFIDDLDKHPECGWVGGVMHKRYPLHYRKKNTPTLKAGIASPIMKLYDDESLPLGQKEEWVLWHKKLASDFKKTWAIQKEFFREDCLEEFPYDYNIYAPTEEDIASKQKVGDGLFEASYCGHVWMMIPEVYRMGLRFKLAPLETGIMFGKEMNEKGLKILCDSNVYVQHISVDGRIYRKDLLALPKLKQRMIPSPRLDDSGVFFERLYEDLEREEYEDIVNAYAKINKAIPHRPAKRETIRDPLTREELDCETWDNKFGKYVRFMTNRKV